MNLPKPPPVDEPRPDATRTIFVVQGGSWGDGGWGIEASTEESTQVFVETPFAATKYRYVGYLDEDGKCRTE